MVFRFLSEDSCNSKQDGALPRAGPQVRVSDGLVSDDQSEAGRDAGQERVGHKGHGDDRATKREVGEGHEGSNHKSACGCGQVDAEPGSAQRTGRLHRREGVRMQRRSLEREESEGVSDSSLRDGCTVPLGGSLMPMRVSTSQTGLMRFMHRRVAGSQRPFGAIRAVRLDEHVCRT